MKKLISTCFLAVMFLAISSSSSFAQTLPSCGQGQANGLLDGDIDHFDIVCFESIPDSFIDLARQMKLLFVDRSVGDNISGGLTCLGSGIPFSEASGGCTTGLTQSTYISDTKYSRSNWDFAHYGDGGWYDNVENYILHEGLIVPQPPPPPPSPTQPPLPHTTPYSDYDAMNFQFSYLSVMPGGDISGPNGFFAAYPGDVNRIRDIHDMAAFDSSYPDITFFYATTSLARSIGGTNSFTFNNQMRSYAQTNNIPLIDFADIGSHSPTGVACVDASGYPVLCADYTSESNGGHLTSAFSRQRPAKAMWIMMASLAGWTPNTATTTPTGGQTATATATNTATSTPAPIPGDANGDGSVDGIDYIVWLNHYNTSVTGMPEPFSQYGDFNHSGFVDGVDYIVWLSNYSE